MTETRDRLGYRSRRRCRAGLPALPFLFIEHFTDVVPDHCGVAAAILAGVFFRTAKDFSDEVGDVLRMIGGHIAEDRTNEVVFEDLIVEDAEKLLYRFFASGPFV